MHMSPRLQLLLSAVAALSAIAASADACALKVTITPVGDGCCEGTSVACDGYGYNSQIVCKGQCESHQCCCATSHHIVLVSEWWDCQGTCPAILCSVVDYSWVPGYVPQTCACACGCPN